MISPLLENPAPDFAALEQVLSGDREPERVHIIELRIDQEVLKAIGERSLDVGWTPWSKYSPDRPPEAYVKQLIKLYYHLGYDFVPAVRRWAHHPPLLRRRAGDTAALSRGKREWVDESHGLISSWADFETFPWTSVRPDTAPCRLMAEHLPAGMKLTVSVSLFEHIMEYLLGYQGLFYLLHDQPDLVAQVFARWGQKVYDYYEEVIGMDAVGAIFHADDMGFKTSTMLSPDALRQLVFPWLKRCAALAHRHGKPFWIHSCGNHYRPGTIEDLIEDVQIDGLHSFQDSIMPVVEFKSRYGERVAALGGVDMDKLVRLEKGDLRTYVRGILDHCMPGGRFALGAGNTVANYVPLQNYFVMLDEARKWRP